MKRKQLYAPDDYTIAYELVNDLKEGKAKIVSIDNVKAFRKYISDLGSKQDKKFYTRKNSLGLLVGRIS